MSVNISLADTPGVSAFFDGQPIQDELEAEIRREEERQEKELRDLLATELEDFEEDFLSDSNSEDDSVNVSRASRASSNKFRLHENSKASNHVPNQMAELDPDSLKTGPSHGTESSQGAFFSPLSIRNQPVFQNPKGLVQNQQTLQQQQHQASHLYHQDQAVNYPQRQFIPGAEYDTGVKGHERVESDVNAFKSYGEDNDEWMMRVQNQAVAVSSASPYHQSSHHHQQQQYFTTLPQPSAGITVTDNPPLPIPNHLRHMQPFHSPVTKSIPSQPSTPKQIPHGEPPTHLSPAAPVMSLENSRHNVMPENRDEYDNYQVQYKMKSKGGDVNENDFYIQNENVEFFKAEGGEEKRSYQQLEILYRARGRELDDVTWKLKQAEEDAAKEVRMFKHKLALANGELEGGQESLRQCQSLLQQAKADLTESQGLVRMLETQVAAFKDSKEELIKKLQVAESTIENLSHQCEELQQSESLSRARNEHESVVGSLTQRFERELLTVREKWDETKSNLTAKHDEVVWLKKQLAESTKELEQAQISRGETINRLARSLEDSQRQCQTLLEQSSCQEVASLKIKLQQTVASKSISEDTCASLQGELKELKEQLTMFETASTLGAFSSTTVTSSHKLAGPSLDDSMADLGIKKTLDFDTPHSTPQMADTSSLEDLVVSLRSELERCLLSNRQKRSEIAGKAEEIQSLKQELQMVQSKSEDLERTCANQRTRLADLESMMSNSNGESILEVRLRRDLDAVAKEKALLLEDIEDYKKRLEEVGASEAKLTEINTELSAQIAQMVSDFDADKATALDRCQRTLEEVHHMTLENMRSELENRLVSEKGMLSECNKMELDRLRDQLNSAQEEAHSVKTLYIQACDEMKSKEEETRSVIRKEVEEELATLSRCKEESKEMAMVQEEKKKRVCAEENFQKEKDSWDQKKEVYEKEIRDSKEVIAELKSSHEKDLSALQETISNVKSQHSDDMRKMQEESCKVDEIEKEWKNKVDVLEHKHEEQKVELQRLIQQDRLKSEETSEIKKGQIDVSVLMSTDMEDASVQTEGQCEGTDSDIEDSLRKRLAQIESDLKSTKEENTSVIERLKSEHRKEFEKAARSREEKFQTELRYFLKDRDDRSKERLEQALIDSKLEFEKRLEENDIKHKLEMEQLRKELDDAPSTEASGNKTVSNRVGKVMEEIIAKLKEEKSVMKIKIGELESEKQKEVLGLMERHAKEEKALTEKYSNEIERLTQMHKDECAELQQKLKDLERAKQCSQDSSLCVGDKDEIEKAVNARVQEERAKWFKGAQDYIKNEIEAGLGERQSAEGSDAISDKFQEEVKRNVELELGRIKNKRNEEIEEEINTKVKEKLEEEMRKLKTGGEEKDGEHERLVNSKVKQKLAVEIENLKRKFLSELEARVGKEKAQLEQDVKRWKEEMKKKIEGDKELFVEQMNREMEEKISEEKRKVEEEVMQCKEEDMREMRKEMEDEMRKRIEKEKRDWRREKEWKNDGGAEDNETSLRLRAAEDACAKACREREQTVDLMKRREAAYKEDRQKLMAGLKQVRQDFNASKEEQAALEDKYAQMDRKYKDDMKEAKKRKEMALEELQTRAIQEQENLIMDYKTHIAALKDEFSIELDRVRSEAEMDRAAALMEVRSHTERALTLSPLQQEPDAETTTLFELRDHYLETVAKIKEDVMSHVQAANSRAASTMKTEMRKQRRRLVHVFRERCKTSIHTILSGQVPSTVLNALDHAIDVIADAMTMTPKSATSTASPHTPRSDSNTPLNIIHQKMLNDNKNIVDREHPQTLKNHPQLAKVDLYDSEAAGSSPQTSAQSSPASLTPRSRSVIHGSGKIFSDPQVPPLDLSPFHTAEQREYSSPTIEDERHKKYLDDYSNNARHMHRRPRSAEATGSRSYKAPTNQRQMSKTRSHSKEVGTMEKESSGEKESELSPSPRDKMKIIEARVRLGKWATSGEMPWKASDSKTEKDGRSGYDTAASSSPRFDTTDNKHYSLDKASRKDNQDNAEDSIFVRPGKEAEVFLKAQRSMKRRDDDLVTPYKKERQVDPWSGQAVPNQEGRSKPQQSVNNYQRRPVELDGYSTDDSNMSNDSHPTFVTLEPDADYGTRGISVNQGLKDKDWSMYTSDYDRIKAAVFDKPEPTLKSYTRRRGEMKAGGLGISSDDDAISVGSDDVPHFQPLPTSTPTKYFVGEREHPKSKGTKSTFEIVETEHTSKHRRNAEEKSSGEPQEWKALDTFAGYPECETLHREYTTKQSHPYSTSSKSKSAQRPRETTKSIDFEFPDLSGITEASGEIRGGRGMWRYKSLEDLLPRQDKRQGEDISDWGEGGEKYRSGNRNHQTGVADNKTSSANMKKPEQGGWSQSRRAPVQAMNSDFWRKQNIDDDEDDKRIDPRRPWNRDQWEKQTRRYEDPVHDHKSHTSGHRNHQRPADGSYEPRPYSRQVQSSHMMTKPSSEPSWNKRQSKRNQANPSYSSSPSYTSQRRPRTSSSSPKPQTLHKSSYSPQFDAHVDDLRKSLETMETNTFGSNLKGKSKMKRSVSEQSLHTIHWDHDQRSDIDDLVMAYTSGGCAQSHFDLHNFGHEEDF